jgi:hypothetical protein
MAGLRQNPARGEAVLCFRRRRARRRSQPNQYVEADLAMKEKALRRLQDPETPVRRFRATHSLLEFLKTL